MSYNTTIIEKIFRGHTMAVFANPPLPPLNGPLCISTSVLGSVGGHFVMRQTGFKHSYTLQHTHLLTHLNWNSFTQMGGGLGKSRKYTLLCDCKTVLHKWVGDLETS